MKSVYDVTDAESQSESLDAAAAAIAHGALVVMPTDTVYGIAADAFSADGVHALLSAKGRGREKPSAVLVPRVETVDGLAMSVPSYARRLMERFWPGALTLIFRAQPSLAWDLGDTNGTVGLRMPDDEVALALLEKTGPLAVSSANRTGEPPVASVVDAGFAFGPAVEVYLDAGVREGGVPSTIIDCTKPDPVLLRCGGVSADQLRDVLGPVDLLDSTKAPSSEAPDGLTPEQPNGIGAPAEESAEAGVTAESEVNAGGIGAEPPFVRDAESGVERPIHVLPSND